MKSLNTVFLLWIVVMCGCAGSNPPSLLSDAPTTKSAMQTDYRILVVEEMVTVGSTNRVLYSASPGGSSICNGVEHARFNQRELELFFTRLSKLGLFSDRQWTNQNWWGPDSSRIRMQFEWRGKTVALASWHEKFERNLNLFVNQEGVRTRDALKGAQPESTWTAEYAEFRSKWAEVRRALEELCNSDGASSQKAPPRK